jgi:uncharacterized protein YdaT
MGVFEKIKERLVEASRTNNGDVHVIPTEGKWAVRKEGAEKSSKPIISKEKAIKKAEGLIVDHNTSKVIVHNYDGTIDKSYQ